MPWVTLDELKSDLGVETTDHRDDGKLQAVLDAAVAFVERVRPGFNYGAQSQASLPAPSADVVLGTVRLAGRWHTRRRSPDGLVAMAELGVSRIPSFDPDVERLLGLGRYRSPVIA